VTTITRDLRSIRNVERRSARSDREEIEHVEGALAVLQGKWKVHLLFFMARGVHRHSKLLQCLPGASKKVMTDSLRALERDGLVIRRIYPEVPARVEYSLSPLGWTITEPLVALAEWGAAHSADVARAQAEGVQDGPSKRRASSGRRRSQPLAG
jgi:DNA-binding HxlR family transcriptional regulator